jgi:hypothetical protein
MTGLSRNTTGIVVGFATLCFLLSMATLVLPVNEFNKLNGLSELALRASISGAISTGIAIIVASYAIVLGSDISKSEHQVLQSVKLDTICLIACLESLERKFNLFDDSKGMPLNELVQYEIQKIQEFLCSSTGYLFLCLTEHKPKFSSLRPNTPLTDPYMFLHELTNLVLNCSKENVYRVSSIKLTLYDFNEHHFEYLAKISTNISKSNSNRAYLFAESASPYLGVPMQDLDIARWEGNRKKRREQEMVKK